MLVLLSKCIYIILYRDNLFPNARGMACRPQKKSTGQIATTSRAFPAAFPAPGSSKARVCRLTPSSKTPEPDARPKKSPAPISSRASPSTSSSACCASPGSHRPRTDEDPARRKRSKRFAPHTRRPRRAHCTRNGLGPLLQRPVTRRSRKSRFRSAHNRGSKLAVSAESHRPKYRRHHFLHQCLAHHSHPATDGAARGRECLTGHFHLCHLSSSATIPAPAHPHLLVVQIIRLVPVRTAAPGATRHRIRRWRCFVDLHSQKRSERRPTIRSISSTASIVMAMLTVDTAAAVGSKSQV